MPDKMPINLQPCATAAAYVAFGVAWILSTDVLVLVLIDDPAEAIQWEMAKGWLFVALSGIVIFLVAREAQRRERTLREREAELMAITDNLPGPVSRVDRDGLYQFANAAYQTWYGLAPAEVVGRSPRDVLGPDLYGQVEPDIRRALAGEAVQYVAPTRLPSGETRWSLVSLIPNRDADGAVIGHFNVALDITARRQAEAEIRELNASLEARVIERTEQLNKALERAESADRMKSAFLATMSHELRTPLNSIIGFTGILLQQLPGPINAEQSKQLGIVRDASRHLLALINDVLDISKIEAGQLHVACEPFDLHASIERVVSLIRPLAERKGLALEVVIDDSIPAVRGDARRVEEVLMNLLGNAVKFTDEGSVSLRADWGTGEPDGEAATGHSTVRLRVVDTGIGLRAGDLERLFQPFHQIEEPSTRQHSGSGLGLAIAQGLARLMGGEIRVESEWQQGSTFTLVLPLPCEEAP